MPKQALLNYAWYKFVRPQREGHVTSVCLITMREMIMKLAMAGQQIGSKFIVTRGKALLEFCGA